MFISYIKLGSSNLPPGIIKITFYTYYMLLIRSHMGNYHAYLEKLVNSPNLNFGAERLVGSSPTVSNFHKNFVRGKIFRKRRFWTPGPGILFLTGKILFSLRYEVNEGFN
jgi:hypothetical protein